MANPLPVEELNVVGYSDVLADTMLPSIVPPVFRLRNNPTHYFLPPYSLSGGYLCNAFEVSEHEIRELLNDGEITLFNEEIPAEREFELYVDQSFQHHYEPREIVKGCLAEIADRYFKEADEALIRRDFEEADRLASIAISADDKRLAPLVIIAAIHRARGDKAGEQLMAALAKPSVTEAMFRKMVDKYDRPVGTPVKIQAPHSPMREMAMAA